MTLPGRFAAHLDRTGLLAGPATAVVAVSGGADSVALLDLLAAVATSRGLTLVIAHADHGIRPDSRTVAQGVVRLAAQYGLPFELGELRLGPGTAETAARRARYQWLRDVQARCGARWLVTAHHTDDQIETVVLRVLRGSAPAGLAGIAARSRGGLVRPLLPFAHAELVAHCRARGLPFHEDPENGEPRHLRSWVRTAILPLLEQRLGARVRSDLLRLGRHAARERRAWGALLDTLPELGYASHGKGCEVVRATLARYDEAVAIALLRAAARRVGLTLGPAAARRALALTGGPSGRRVELGGGWTAAAAGERLILAPPESTVTAAMTPAGARGQGAFGAYRVTWRREAAPPTQPRGGWTAWLAADAWPDGWEARALAPGDRIVPLGGVGRRPVRRLLMEAGVPRASRAAWPVVTRGATVVWVPGICRGAAALPPAGTEAVRLDVIPGSDG